MLDSIVEEDIDVGANKYKSKNKNFKIVEEMEMRITKMAYAHKLLPYLGFTGHSANVENRFFYALRKVKEYEGEILIEEEQVSDYRLLSQLNDPIMNRLFISIVEIIQFFCK